MVLMLTSQADITQLLIEASHGDNAATDELFEKVYRELRKLAKDYLRQERPDHTLQATALVHEAYLRLVKGEEIPWQNRAHFFSIAAQVMRNILVDHARQHKAGKRGGGAQKLSLDEAISFSTDRNLDLVALDDALKVLQGLNEQQCRIVELKFFGGLQIEEIAAVLDIDDPKVAGRQWRKAKMWLRTQLLAGEKQ
jgi:RNA polymerase sigma factor (TIGR02999 family)